MKKAIAPKKKVAPKVASKKAGLRQRVSAEMDVDGIISRIMDMEGVVTYKGVAEVLGMKPQSLSGAKSAGKIPLDVLNVYVTRHGISFDWLLTGEHKGVPKELIGIAEDSPVYEVVKAMKAMHRSKWSLVRDIIKRMSEEGK